MHWNVRHKPQNHRLVHNFSGQGIRPTLESATGADPEAKQVKSGGEGGVSCGEGVRIPSRASVAPLVGRGAHGLLSTQLVDLVSRPPVGPNLRFKHRHSGCCYYIDSLRACATREDWRHL